MLQPKDRLAEWIQKQDPYICCLQKTHRSRDTYRLKVRRRKKVFHTNGNQKKARVAMLISAKIDFKIKTVTRDKEGYYIMIKGSIQEEDITIVKGFPGGTVVENLLANAGDEGSSPGLGRSHMPRSNSAHEPQLLSLRVWSLCSATKGCDSERPAHRDEEWPPLATTRESPRTETKTQHSHTYIHT